jgi:hypothetical protein
MPVRWTMRCVSASSENVGHFKLGVGAFSPNGYFTMVEPWVKTNNILRFSTPFPWPVTGLAHEPRYT